MINASPVNPHCSLCHTKDSHLSMSSPVEFAFQQMKDAGVIVIDHYSWTISSSERKSKVMNKDFMIKFDEQSYKQLLKI